MSATTESAISEMVERLVRGFDPLRIVLFGSHARGDANRYSDVDLLVVLPEVEDAQATAAAMSEALRPMGNPNDVWVTDPRTIARNGDKVGGFLYPVLREGMVIYGVDDRDAGTWLRYAEEDLDVAERMTSEEGWTPRIACFHAQQAAEKALKAVLVAERLPLVYTHALELLRDSLPEESRTRKVGGDLKWLAGWAVLPRYPRDVPDATREDAVGAVELAQSLVEAARQDVRGEG